MSAAPPPAGGVPRVEGVQPAGAPFADDDLITAWGLVAEATVAVRTHLAAGLEAAGHVSVAEYDVLIRLRREPGHRLPMTRLALEIGLTSGGFTKLADRMEQGGLIARQPSARDRRITFAVLTDEGAKRTDATLLHHVADLRQHLEAPLGTERLRQFAALARQLRDSQPAGR